LDRLFDDLEQPAGNPQSVFRVHACQTQREFIVTDPRKDEETRTHVGFRRFTAMRRKLNVGSTTLMTAST
jgi:hypothetical protein